MALYLRKLDKATHTRLKVEAARQKVSIEDLAIQFIKEGLRQHWKEAERKGR